MGQSEVTPNDLVAEESLLGAMLLSPSAVLVAMERVVASDFYRPLHQQIFAAMCSVVANGIELDPVIVASEMNNNEIVSKLIGLAGNTPSHTGAGNYADIIRKHSVARSLISKMRLTQTDLMSGSDPYQEANAVEKFVSMIGVVNSTGPESVTLAELERNADAIAPVVIPGMMHRDYRTIVVAEEGAGKSLLLRTIAMSAAQGYHPFSHRRIDPVRALIVDLENPTQAITQTAVPFSRMLQSLNPENYEEERLRFWRRPGGIEIRSLSDRAELQREIAFHKPELVVIGPIYKMYRRGSNESYEDSADQAMAVLDDLRTKYGFALIMEHHAAKGRAGERELTPMGSQRWMAWPEIGISLYKDKIDKTVMHVERYRGDRLQGVSWPDKIVRDPNWLVEGVWMETL
jgi:replicative DNA helicase